MKYKLSNICEYVKGKVAVSTLNTSNYISTENMLPSKGGIVDATTLPPAETTQSYSKDDVLVSNIRPYFEKIWKANSEGGCSNDVLVFRAKPQVNPTYLYYVLSDKQFFDYATATSKGTKMPRGDRSAIMEYEIEERSRKEQDNIAAILYSLDKKIELNNKINNNLFEQAQALYTSMFITNADPSWQQGRLSDLITVRYGKDHKKLADGVYPVYGSGGIMRYAERPLYEHESVLIPRKGTLNNVMYVNESFWSVDTMFYTEMRVPNVAKFVYHFVKSKDLASMNTGSAVPSMTTDILNAMELAIPSELALAQFENLVAPMYRAMKANDIQTAQLINLRDSILPKLMSGELDVSTIEI